jgi:hypothetical protein
MAFESRMTVLSWPALGDLSNYQFYPVTLATSSTYPEGYITTISATATKPVGILQDAPSAAGQMAAVCVGGISKCAVYTGTLAVEDAIGVNTNGLGAVTTTDNQWIVGTAYEKQSDQGTGTIVTVNVGVSRY